LATPDIARKHPVSLAIALAIASAPAGAATIFVTDGGDAGTSATCTLRQAIDSANKNTHGETSNCIDGSGADTIVFDPALAGATITLAGSQLAIKSPIEIVGSGQTLDAGQASRVLSVDVTTFAASDIALVNGVAQGNSGAGLLITGSTVTLSGVSISGNSSDYAAGIAAFNYSEVTLNATSISGNDAARKGGGMEIVNGTSVVLQNSVVTGNHATRGGGIFIGYHGSLSLRQSTISDNTATSAPTLSGGAVYGYRCTAGTYRTTAAAPLPPPNARPCWSIRRWPATSRRSPAAPCTSRTQAAP
jgi:hypothetical protein